jgi:hypothetical protein
VNYELDTGDIGSAIIYYSEALVIHQGMRNDHGVETIMGCLAEVAMSECDFKGAEELYTSGLRIAYREGARRDVAYLVLGLAQCLSNSSSTQERAALLFGAADAQNDWLGLPWEKQPTFIDRRGERQAHLRQSMGEQAFDAAYAHGRGLTLDAAVALALNASD